MAMLIQTQSAILRRIFWIYLFDGNVVLVASPWLLLRQILFIQGKFKNAISIIFHLKALFFKEAWKNKGILLKYFYQWIISIFS